MSRFATPCSSTRRMRTRSEAVEREAARTAAILSATLRPGLNRGSHFCTGK
jgi:hypothetical protein